MEDYGKTAAIFVDTVMSQAAHVAPVIDICQKAGAYVSGESRRYFAQTQAYQIMPDEELFTVTPVLLNTPIEAIVSSPGLCVNCALCGEEIMN